MASSARPIRDSPLPFHSHAAGKLHRLDLTVRSKGESRALRVRAARLRPDVNAISGGGGGRAARLKGDIDHVGLDTAARVGDDRRRAGERERLSLPIRSELESRGFGGIGSCSRSARRACPLRVSDRGDHDSLDVPQRPRPLQSTPVPFHLQDEPIGGELVSPARAGRDLSLEFDHGLLLSIDGPPCRERRQAAAALPGPHPVNGPLHRELAPREVVAPRTRREVESSPREVQNCRGEENPARRIELDSVRFSESSLLVGPANVARQSRLLRPLVVLGAIGLHGERLALFWVESQRDLVEHIDIRQQARGGPETDRPFRPDSEERLSAKGEDGRELPSVGWGNRERTCRGRVPRRAPRRPEVEDQQPEKQRSEEEHRNFEPPAAHGAACSIGSPVGNIGPRATFSRSDGRASRTSASIRPARLRESR